MPELSSLKVGISLDDSEFSKGISRSLDKVKHFGAALTGAVAGLGALTISGLNEAKQQRLTAARIGDSVEATSALTGVAKIYGLEVDDITGAMDMFSEMLGEALNGSKSQLDAFKLLGFGIKDLEQLALLPAVKRFGVLMEALRLVRKDTDRAIAGNTLLGGDFLKLIPLIKAGTTELNSLARALERAGVIMDTKFAEGAEKSLQGVGMLTAIIGNLDVLIAKQFGPSLGRTAKIIGDALPAAVAAAQSVIDGIGASVAAFFHIGGKLLSGDFSGAMGNAHFFETIKFAKESISAAYNEPVQRAVDRTIGGSAFQGGGPFGVEREPPTTKKQTDKVIFLLESVDGVMKDLRNTLGTAR